VKKIIILTLMFFSFVYADFITVSATEGKKDTLRKQRDVAYKKARIELTTLLEEKTFGFVKNYLKKIGIQNRSTIKKLAEYVVQDMQKVNKYIEQTDVSLSEDFIMSVVVGIDKEIYKKELKKSIQKEFKNDIIVWNRYSKQDAQDLLNTFLNKI